ncbi:Long-chain-fatty-acid--CoA ligase [Roseibacterium elongatum DSM 19469]|uniref:Long-chain-fatty-acid--CoA ligase n=1 Tax=Roseicyclus elongatus DSM 19469 TaxID=1294273 RepID=W8RPS2_9RHOB|nr:AMP-binding protein [Roseibacterium elongatum]AHM03028.1 Long-chain-fatty-acid--CoA ligase [Roseibacterium elongatum DSM 19469]
MATNPIHEAFLTGQPEGDPFLMTPDGGTLTYGGLRARVAQMAGALQAQGMGPGDRVLCQIEKSPQALILYLATAIAGGVFIPLNTAYTPVELAYFLDDAAPVLLVVDDSTAGARPVADARGVAVVTASELMALDSAPLSDPLARKSDDLAAILYTSGTTGRSKGAMLTHENLISNAKTLCDAWRFERSDVLLHALPVFHTHGLFVATNIALLSGSSMIFHQRFDLDQIARDLPRATAIMGVPTFYSRMLGDDRFDRAALAHMRLIVSGSAPLLAETHAAFETRTGHAILERYGMTETNMITTNPYDGPRRAGTVGHPLPGVSVRLVDPDDQGIGGIEVKGPNVTPGYWQNAEKTAESFTEDGWFITGDLGQFDDDGYLSIVGRAKDLVISGGFNIYPKEVETEIDALPGVVESAVYGAPDPDLGEAVAAAVVLEPGARTDAAQIISALSGRLARFKIPRSIRIMPELPRNAMGKVQKAELRKEAAEQS